MIKSAVFALGALSFAAPSFGAEVAPMALNGFSSVPKKLAAAVVFDQNDRAIGIVKTVSTDADGRPTSVEVMLPGGAGRQVSARAASYDPIANQLVVENTQVAQAVVADQFQSTVTAPNP